MLANVFSTGLSALYDGTYSMFYCCISSDLTTVLFFFPVATLYLALLSTAAVPSLAPMNDFLCTLCEGGMEEEPRESGLLGACEFMPLLAMPNAELSLNWSSGLETLSGMEASEPLGFIIFWNWRMLLMDCLALATCLG